MSFFGIQIHEALQHTDSKIYYSYLTATRIEDMEKVE